MTNKYIRIQQINTDPSRKTKTFIVINTRSDFTIGTIRWYCPWKRYVFLPKSDTVWDIGCMQEIIDFIKNIKKA